MPISLGKMPKLLRLSLIFTAAHVIVFAVTLLFYKQVHLERLEGERVALLLRLESSLSAGQGFSQDGESASVAMEPGYPFFLAKNSSKRLGNFFFLGQILLYGAAACLVSLWASQLEGERIGVISLWLMHLFWPLASLAHGFNPELLVIVILVQLGFLVSCFWKVSPSYLLVGFSGILIGFLGLLSAPLTLFGVVFAFYARWREKLNTSLALVFCIASLLLPTAWIIRNAVHHEAFIPSSAYASELALIALEVEPEKTLGAANDAHSYQKNRSKFMQGLTDSPLPYLSAWTKRMIYLLSGWNGSPWELGRLLWLGLFVIALPLVRRLRDFRTEVAILFFLWSLLVYSLQMGRVIQLAPALFLLSPIVAMGAQLMLQKFESMREH